MEAYILDGLYRRIQVVDTFESFIWTERFSAYGDFELSIQSTRENRNLFSEGVRLATNESYRVMTVETIEDGVDADGRTILKVKGRSLEEIFDNRLARSGTLNLTTEPKWILTGTPVEIANKIFHDICVLGNISTRDILPSVIEDSLFPPDTIAAPTEEITYEVEPKTMYVALKELCDLYDLGFRLIRNFDTTDLYFDIYTGSDRTSAQFTLPAVIFSPDLDNLQNTAELASTAAYKNVVRVISPVGTVVVYPEGIDMNLVKGFERRQLLVVASDITDEDAPTALAKMTQRGKEELAKSRRIMSFDGEINQNSQYRYGRDYNLGDIVEMRNGFGATNNMRVTEQIFVSDREGERSYPTLALSTFIMPGTWLAWDYNQVWADLGTEKWAEQ